MAKANNTSKPRATKIQKEQRTLTVGIQPEHYPKKVIPFIRLRGKWLAEAGFAPKKSIFVRIMNGCIVLTIDENKKI